MMQYNPWLLTGGILSAAASLLHIGCVWGGPAWYRFFGAGEYMARQAERGEAWPAFITFVIAATLASWSAYALSGAKVLPRLPFLVPILTVIAGIYLLRAFALPVMILAMPDRGISFLAISSVIVFVVGGIHAVGVYVLVKNSN